MAITKFGQYVLMQVHNDKGGLVFETDSLRVDFDIRHIRNWSRAKFTLINAAPDTIKKISDADNSKYVTIKTSLHGGELTTIANQMYVSNALEEVKVPNSEFNIYCYSKLRKAYLEQQVDTSLNRDTLKNIILNLLREVGFAGSTEFKHFPPDVLSFVCPKPKSRYRGSLLTILEKLGEQYSFNFYTVDSKLVFMCKPDAKNVQATDLYSSTGEIVLAVSNMRSNPKIGPATLKVVANLDPRIVPATVLDISQLLTVGTNTSDETLQVAENYLREKVAGFSKYQALTIQHKGSNWTPEWKTVVAATSPTPGTTMSSDNWWL